MQLQVALAAMATVIFAASQAHASWLCEYENPFLGKGSVFLTDTTMAFDYSEESNGDKVDLVEQFTCHNASICLWEGDRPSEDVRTFVLSEVVRDDVGVPVKARDFAFDIAENGEHSVFGVDEINFSNCVSRN